MNIKIVAKLNLLFLLSESKNFRNDGWIQQGYKKKYKEALLEYITNYSSLKDVGRE